jgi:tetratricopeptide (TPR) repeat protein
LNLTAEQVRDQLLQSQQLGPRPLRQANPRVDEGLARLVERCLAFDPKDRPRDGAELAAALRGHLSWRRRARRWVAAHSWSVAAAACLLLVLGGAGAYLGYALAAAVAPGHSSDSVVDDYQAGLTAYRDGRLDAALELLSRAIKVNPENWKALYYRGRAYQRRGEIKLAQQPNALPAAQEDWLSAVRDYENAANLVTDWRILESWGCCLNGLGDSDKAIEKHKRAIAAAPAESAELLNNLGYSYLQSAKYDEAWEALEEAVALDNTLQAAYLNGAWCSLCWFNQNLSAINDGTIPAPVYEAWVRSGIADIRKAITSGSQTTDSFYVAACLYAIATRQDDGWIKETLDHRRQALQRGQKQLGLDHFMVQMSKENPKLMEAMKADDEAWANPPEKPAVQPRSEAIRLVDAVKDDFQ